MDPLYKRNNTPASERDDEIVGRNVAIAIE
jgi:hypothetical protein